MSADLKQTFTGRHLVNERLSRAGSEKQVRHHEIGVEGGPLPYLPGDAVGVRPANDPALVDRLARLIGAADDEPVTLADGTATTFRAALSHACSLETPSRRLLELIAGRGATDVGALLDRAHADDLERYVEGHDEAHDVLDVVAAHPEAHLDPGEFVAALRRMPPRLYSIASSPRTFPDRVHLLIASVRYTIRGRERLGVGSTWFEARWPIGDTAEFYLQNQQRHFAMPASPDTAMIMVGPGTGVAPFRAFLQDRRASGARGRNWLFFGDQRRSTDFLYEDELTGYVRDGLLRLDLAFSRDQAAKIYVQDRLREQAADVWRWLEDGAELFVCGNKDRMAADVDRQLHEIIQTAGGKSADNATAYVERLKSEKRYKRDVY